MPIEQEKSQKKLTGGRLKDYRKRRQYAEGNRPTMTQIGEGKQKAVRTLGGNTKQRLRFTQKIAIGAKGKTTVEEIVNVEENDANRNYVRRNIITKGAIVTTKSGKKVKVTSRPGQSATLAGVLVE